MLISFPSDEVGNGILDEDKLDNSKFDVTSVISEKEYYENFGDFLHPFTGINMIDFYKELIESENCQVEFVFANDAREILNYTKNVLNCDIHTRYKTKKLLEKRNSIHKANGIFAEYRINRINKKLYKIKNLKNMEHKN